VEILTGGLARGPPSRYEAAGDDLVDSRADGKVQMEED